MGSLCDERGHLLVLAHLHCVRCGKSVLRRSEKDKYIGRHGNITEEKQYAKDEV